MLINWRSSDIETTRNALLSRGVDCTELLDYPELKLFTFFDPEGTYHDCCQFGSDWLPEKP